MCPLKCHIYDHQTFLNSEFLFLSFTLLYPNLSTVLFFFFKPASPSFLLYSVCLGAGKWGCVFLTRFHICNTINPIKNSNCLCQPTMSYIKLSHLGHPSNSGDITDNMGISSVILLGDQHPVNDPSNTLMS